MFSAQKKAIKHVFVPMTDDLLFDHPDAIEGPLIPYASGMACHGWLSVELNPAEASAGGNALNAVHTFEARLPNNRPTVVASSGATRVQRLSERLKSFKSPKPNLA